MCWQQGRLKQAAEACSEAVLHQPENVDAYLQLGQVLQQSRSIDRAIAVYQKGLVVLPDSSELWCDFGVALLRAQKVLDSVSGSTEFNAGVSIIRKAIEEPLRRIAENAGIDGSIVVDKVKNSKGSMGFNAQTEEYEDLIKAGVIDPTKVVRIALQNASSVASLLLTTEAMVADKPEEKGDGGGGMPGGGMPGGMGGMGGMM